MEILYKCTEFGQFDHSRISESRIHPIWLSCSLQYQNYAGICQSLTLSSGLFQQTARVVFTHAFKSSIGHQRCRSVGSVKDGKGAGVTQGGGEWHRAPLEQPAAEAATPLLRIQQELGAAASSTGTLILVRQFPGSSLFVQQHLSAADEFLLPILSSDFRKKPNTNSS